MAGIWLCEKNFIWVFNIIITILYLSNSRIVATLHLSSNVGRDVLGIPLISRHLFCIDYNSSVRYCKPPHNGEAYSRSGCILVQHVVMPISVCRFAFLQIPSNNTISGWLSLLSVQNGNSNIGCLVAITPVAKTWKVSKVLVIF